MSSGQRVRRSGIELARARSSTRSPSAARPSTRSALGVVTREQHLGRADVPRPAGVELDRRVLVRRVERDPADHRPAGVVRVGRLDRLHRGVRVLVGGSDRGERSVVDRSARRVSGSIFSSVDGAGRERPGLVRRQHGDPGEASRPLAAAGPAPACGRGGSRRRPAPGSAAARGPAARGRRHRPRPR